MMNNFNIGQYKVGNGERCFVIAEIAQAHDGSLGMAHAYIDAIARTGADAIKFQTHYASEESSPAEPWRVKFSKQDATRFEYWQRMEFTEEQWLGLKQHAEDKGLIFLSSPFSFKAVDLLAGMDMAAWKVASGEINNEVLLEKICQTGKPVLLSTGMSHYAEINQAVELIKSFDVPYAVMQCTTSYPTPANKIGLNLLQEYRERYNCPVGLSDHSATIFAGLAAATLETDILEIHVTMSRDMFGPDVVASVTCEELTTLVQGIRFIEEARMAPINKDEVAADFKELRAIFNKSIFVNKTLQEGHVLQLEDLAFKKPGSGIPAADKESVLGKKIKTALQPGHMLSRDDFS